VPFWFEQNHYDPDAHADAQAWVKDFLDANRN
jgi:hypothetical protein